MSQQSDEAFKQWETKRSGGPYFDPVLHAERLAAFDYGITWAQQPGPCQYKHPWSCWEDRGCTNEEGKFVCTHRVCMVCEAREKALEEACAIVRTQTCEKPDCDIPIHQTCTKLMKRIGRLREQKP